MNILKSIPMLAAMLLAFAVGAVPAEPAIAPAKKAAVKACPKAAKKAQCTVKKVECKAACAKACKGLPADVKKMPDSDDLFGWYQAKDGKRYLVYEWGKKATVYSVSVAEKQLVAPGGSPVEKINAWSGDENDDYSVADVITVEYRKNNKYLFNVGSIGQPRNGDPRASFAVWDTDAMTVSRYRLPYDFQTTQQKILDAGLPGRLAERLAYGS